MKMKYEKPTVAVENFALSQNIAACSLKIGLTSSMCVIRDKDSTSEMRALAWSGEFINGSCTTSTRSGSSNDGNCYHTNAAGGFSS